MQYAVMPLAKMTKDKNKINELYFVFHTQSMEWCVESLLEIFNLNKNVFDKNWRLKEVIKEKENH